ncbi:MAG: hypothetical protein O4804_10350 [Trichodesmium sp. St11_bin5]|nr:hypothetical protein [Trichodesmium sp. St11_bin5]
MEAKGQNAEMLHPSVNLKTGISGAGSCCQYIRCHSWEDIASRI